MSVNTFDVGSKGGYLAKQLSNFIEHRFTIDGVECASMEGFLQSLKFDKPHIAIEVCKLVGVTAKHRGRDRNNQWKHKQCLWWLGREIERDSDVYQMLIDRAYLAMAIANPVFRKALLDSGDLILTHMIGRSNLRETVLTQREFCERLMKLRTILRNGSKDLSSITRIL